MRRQNVHLSTDKSLAAEVARRHGRSIVMFKVNARAAWTAGIRFYLGSGQIWVSDAIPPEFIERLKD
jgi:putative RNA 2'-phosphotransferase